MFDYGTSYARILIREWMLEAEHGRMAKEGRKATGRRRSAFSLRPLIRLLRRRVPGLTRQPCPEAI